ncbi:MAG: OmpA family protein [Arcobacteraceae bacterium]
MKKLLLILSCISFVFAQNNDTVLSGNPEKAQELFAKTDSKFTNKEYESILRFNPVFFNSSSDEVTDKSQDYLVDEIIPMIKNYEKNYENLTLEIIGHTDQVQTKTEKVNQSSWFRTYPNDLTIESSEEIALSYAKYVQEQLKENDIPEDIIIVRQRGGLDSLYVGVSDETRELNYRAMLSVYIAKAENADSDHDGVIDSKDKCPMTPKGHTVNTDGCSELFNLTIYYNANSYDIRNDSFEKLNKMVAFLNKYPKYKATLFGHTSSEGTKKSNQILSEKRALSMRQYLIEKGISSSKISVFGKASTEPIASNATKAGQEENRRVEIKLY